MMQGWIIRLVSIVLTLSAGLSKAAGLDPRTAFCEKEFDYFVIEIIKLQTNYSILAPLGPGQIRKKLDEKGMNYRMSYSTNVSPPAKTAPKLTSPYLRVDFCIGWRSAEELAKPMQAAILSLEQRVNNGPLNFRDGGLQHLSRSGILIFGGLRTDNKALEKEITRIFEKVLDDIVKWEPEKKTQTQSRR